MSGGAFDQFSELYDAWFLKNRNVLESEILLLKRFLSDPGRSLSVGCGSGLFELLLRNDHGITISHGVEPAEGMGTIAARRGMEVKTGSAESLPYADGEFDTLLMNGTPSYMSDLTRAFAEAHRVLRPGGRLVVADVPGPSSYGLLYRLAARIGRWDDPEVSHCAPADPYPVEFVGAAHWRTTEEIAAGLTAAGFVELEYAQTLLTHPKYSNDTVQQPVDGFDRGDYVAVRARRPR